MNALGCLTVWPTGAEISNVYFNLINGTSDKFLCKYCISREKTYLQIYTSLAQHVQNAHADYIWLRKRFQ